MEQPSGIPIKKILVESAFAGAIALIIFGPVMGIVLQGYDFNAHLMRPINMALLVFFGRTIIEILRASRSQKSKQKPSAENTNFLDRIPPQAQMVIGAAILSFLVILPFFMGKYWLSVLNLALIYVLLGLGLNIVVGLAGLLDLGFVAFYAVGAYGYALGNQYFGLGFWPALFLGAGLAGVFGAVLGFPVLRLHGDYLAIVTLGFGEIIHLVLTNWTEFTGGPNGVSAPAPTLFGLEFRRSAKQGGTPFHEFFGIDYSAVHRYIFLYLALLVFVIIAIGFVVRLKKMPVGRAWEALREDEIACKALGINHVTVKLSAFSLGATIGGVAGVFFAGFQGFIDPLSFTFFESALILAIVVLGGMGSTAGVVIAAVVLTIAPEFLREFSNYRILIFGLLMVSMMIWRPRGLVRSKRQKFDLKALSQG